jgi:hypothetical protein
MLAKETFGVPRGALAVVVLGLVLSGLTAVLTVSESSGGERLDWERSASIPDSAPAPFGEDGSLRITDAGLEATRANASGYSLYRVAGTLNLDLTDFDGRAEARCTVQVPPGSVLARTPNKRASYPLPSEDVRTQTVPELSVVRFNAKGTDVVGVEVEDAFDEFTNSPDVKAEWAPYRKGRQTWEWVLLPRTRTEPVTLSFTTLWRTTGEPGAKIACTAEAAGRTARAGTGGTLSES